MNPVQRIDIPSAKIPTVAQAAGKIVMDALREAGLNPRSATVFNHPMIRGLLGAWGREEISRTEFVQGCRNLGTFNPDITK